MAIIKVDDTLINTDNIEYVEEYRGSYGYKINFHMRSGESIDFYGRLEDVLEQINNKKGDD